MASRYEFNGDVARARIAAEMKARIAAALIALVDHAKVLISTEGAAAAPKSKALKSGRRIRKGGLVYGAAPSKPGDPPHKQTGRLLGSIAWEVAGLAGRAGTNLLYGLRLELGTSKMAARPWLRRAAAEMRAAMKSTLERPFKF